MLLLVEVLGRDEGITDSFVGRSGKVKQVAALNCLLPSLNCSASVFLHGKQFCRWDTMKRNILFQSFGEHVVALTSKLTRDV